MQHASTLTPLTARRSSPLKGRARVPGDKSISVRSLIFGALTVGETRIEGMLEGEDAMSSANAMRALGATLERRGEQAWSIRGVGGSGFAARLRARPLRPILDPLAKMGAETVEIREGGRLPATLRGAVDPIPIVYEVPVPSAQIKSAGLLAGLAAPGTTMVIEKEATRDHTERLLRLFGAEVAVEPHGEGRRITLTGQPELAAAQARVPADPSSAAFPLVAALIVPGSDLIIEGVMMNPLRGGLLTTLMDMGAGLGVLDRRQAG